MEITKNPAYYLSTTSYTSPEMATRLVEYYSSKRRPFEIEVRSNSLTILTNNVVVARDELQIAGNPFEQYLDQYRAKGSEGPYHYCRETGSDEFFAEVLEYSYEHGKRKGVWNMVLPCTALEAPANGRAPVYLECRSNQLFSVSADAPAREFEISNLKSLDPATQFVCLLVRPDSFDFFRSARKAAWERGLDVSCELQDESGPLAIGPEGDPLLPQKTETTAPIFSKETQELRARTDAWLSKAEILGTPSFTPPGKSPIFVEVWQDRIAIAPEIPGLVATGDPEKDFERLLGRMEKLRQAHYFVLIPHPGGAIFQGRLRQLLRERNVDVRVQPPEKDFEAGSQTKMDFHGALPPRPASETRKDPPCDIEVRADSITILSDHTAVTLDELHAPGNAFERLLNRFEADGECPNIQLCEKPGGEPLKTRLGGQIFLAAKSMGCQMKIEALLQDTNSPPAPAQTTQGTVYFECRNGLLYDLSGPGSEGHGIRFQNEEDARWLEPKLAAIKHANQSIHFTVHPDSLEVYRNTRIMAWVCGIPFSKSMLNETVPTPLADQ
ncbi:MAG TPA: hypothetical protein DCM68_01895 [Verrucomicrobia bacterium]|nr:hypothetical protein [Verrucomicrobiota bacterium]